MRTQVYTRMKRFLMTVVGFLAMTLVSFSQVDYEFWFAAPFGNTDHAPFWPESYPYKVGGRPIYLRLATQDAEADVMVTLPALGLTIASVNIAPNSTATVDLTPYIANIQCSKQGNVVEDKGLYIRSNALITAYYEIASVLNTDIFSLKGQNALGKEFYTPFQNKMVNDPFHNGVGVPDNTVVQDSAFSYIVIVATQDHTIVNITPTTNCVGIPSGTTKSVTLDRGQTYVVRAKGQDVNSRLSGTYIKSTKPVAVTIGEDSAYPNYYTDSGDCEDYIGDQIMPTSLTGNKYIIVQGQGYSPSKKTGNNFYELVAITAVKDNTHISLDGAQYGSVLNKGETVTLELTDPNADYSFIETDNPVYAFHISGYHCEVAGALLPSVEMCTGSYKMGFVRTYGSQNDQEFYMNLMVKGDGEKDFLLNGSPNSIINNASFHKIGNTPWKVAKIYFSRSDLPEGAYFLQNTTSLFHMGMMNSTAHDWGDDKGYRLMGSMYGYFSRFSDNFPSAIIVNNNDTSITVTRGTKVSLLADGGNKFSWKGYMWDGHDWALLAPPYYMNVTNVENPYVIIDALGIYKYTATISSDCYEDVERSILIKIVEPVDLNEIHDTVCFTPGLSPNNDMSHYYNLFNLNDTIVGKKGLITGYYVDHFDRFVAAAPHTWANYEDTLLATSKYKTTNGSFSTVSNPYSDEVNSSSKVGYLRKSGRNGQTADDRYTVSLDIDVSEDLMSLSKGGKFSFDVSYDETKTEQYCSSCASEHYIYVDLIDDSGLKISLPAVASFPAIFAGSSSDDDDDDDDVVKWQHVEADFSDFAGDVGFINTVRIRAYYNDADWGCNNPGYYIDNIRYYTVNYHETIKTQDAKHYTITDGDSLFAIVRNNFDLSRSDTTMVYLAVRNPGIEKRTIQLEDMCATEGNELKEFDLTQYNYTVGGALVADRLWYKDQMAQNPIENPQFVDVPAGNTTYYVFVKDECADIPGELKLQVFAIPEVADGETTVCEIPALGGDRGKVDLTAEVDKITTDLGATVQWYSDYQYTKLVTSPSSQYVTDGTKFYAKVFYNEKCESYATLTVNVTPVDDIVFKDFKICEDGGVVALGATPSGGVYSGTGISAGSFDPSVGAGSYELSYTITNEGCTNTQKVTATVNPKVTVTLENLSGKLKKGEQADLKATISPTSSNYSYTWTDGTKLQSTNTLTPKTVALNEPTYYTLDVVNTVTGCSASTRVLVDVYAPVKVALAATPVCAGNDVTFEADRTGGTGPFTYVWSVTPSTPYTTVNDSVIKITNIQSTVEVKVTVTDKTEGDVISATATQTVYENPSISLDGATVCQGNALTLKPTVTGGTPAYTYEWTGNADVMKTATNVQNAEINTLDNVGTYYLTFGVVDKNNCSDSKNAIVVVNQKPIVDAVAGKTTSCFGDPVQLTGSVKTANTISKTHEWLSPSSSTGSLSDTSIPNPQFTSFISGVHTFQYILTDVNGCKDTSEIVSVRIEPRPTVTINPVADQCVTNQGVMLSANPVVNGIDDATFSYKWSGDVTSTDATPMLNITTPGVKNVKLQVTANNGCTSDEVPMQVVVHENPLAEIATKNLFVCAEDEITLQANASSSNVTYEWSSTMPLQETIGSSIKVYPPNSIQETVTYQVDLKVTDNTTKCFSTTSTELTSSRLPEITLGDDFELCDGASIELEPLIKYTYPGSYSTKWFLDTLQLSSTEIMNPTYTQKGTDTYRIGIEIVDANNCKSSDELDITGLQNPVANAGEDRTEDWDNPFILYGSATGGTPEYSYLWSPMDSLSPATPENARMQNPTASLLESNIYTLEVTDSKNCKGTDQVTITIIGQPLKVNIIQRPDPYCYGNKVTLEAIPSGGTGVYEYQWSLVSDPSTVISTEKTIEVAPETATAYKVVLNSVGPKHFDPTEATHTVVVNPLPKISLLSGLNPHVCQGDVTNILSSVTGTSPFTYEWFDGSPVTIKTENYQFSNSQIVGDKELKLIVTDAIGCVDSLTFNVTVDELPEVKIDPIMECVHVETQATAMTSKGAGSYSYIWGGIDGLSSQGNTSKFTIDEAGTYTIEVSVYDANMCNSKGEALVTIKPESTLSLEPTYAVCADEELTLDINPKGIPGNYTMHWVGGDRNRIVDSSIVTKSVFRSANEGSYTLLYTIADEYNCPKQESTTVTVYPAVKLADIEDQNVCAGIDLNLTVEVTTGNPTNYNWLGNVSPVDQKSTVFNSTKDGTYEITVIAGDKNCSDMKFFNVTVQPNPVVKIIGNPIVDYMATTVLTGQLVTYTTAPFEHSWENVADISYGENTSAITTKPIIKTTEYTYTITDKYHCTASASMTIQTEIILPKIMRLCDGTEVEVPANELVDPTQICLTDDVLELCIGESAYLIPQFESGKTDNLSYYWTDDDSNFLGNDINILVSPTKQFTIYTLTISNPFGFTTDVRYSVIAHPMPTAEIVVSPDYNGTYYTESIMVIDGNPSSAENGVSFVSHKWTTSEDVRIVNENAQRTNIQTAKPIEPLKLTYETVDQNGCKASAEKEIAIVNQKIPVIMGKSVCVNSSGVYSLDVKYPEGTIYVWSVENGNIIGESNGPTLEVLWPQTENTKVSVSVYPPNDRPIENISTYVIVTPYPDVTINGEIHVCVGETATYQAIDNKKIDSMNPMYYWSVAQGNGDLVDISKETGLASITWNQEGKDTVKLRASYGFCPTEVDLTVYIHPTPDADFKYYASEDVYFIEEDKIRHTDSIFVGKDVTFKNLTTKYSTFDFYWDFIGDGVYTENSYDALYEYDEVGDFNVSLMVVDKTWGCKNVVSKPLKVVPNPNCGLVFPNAFTPDLSENNTFYPVFKAGVLESGYELRVYNRWGTLLWTTTDLEGQWDGVYKGSISKQDVYVYHCKATCEDIDPATGKNRVLNVKGDVTIIR